jgi:hypothetical protein
MTSDARTASRGDYVLYLVGIVLSAPPLISLLHRQLHVPVAEDIHLFVTGYRSVADAVATVMQTPLKAVAIPPPESLMDLHVLSFAGMGMMTKGMQAPGEKIDWFGATMWGFVSTVLALLLVGVLVFGAILARFIASPITAFRSDHWIETTPRFEGLQGRLKREREFRLERDLARIMAATLVLVGGYFALNAILLGAHA